jgi:hypothetical protein
MNISESGITFFCEKFQGRSHVLSGTTFLKVTAISQIHTPMFRCWCTKQTVNVSVEISV